MNEKIKIWMSKVEQIYNNFAQRKNLKIWQELLNEVSFDSPVFLEWRNQFLLYLDGHPFLSLTVYELINQTFHIAEDYYVTISEEEKEKKENKQDKSVKEKKEFKHIVSVIQEENIYVSEPLFYRSHLFDIDRMEAIAGYIGYGAPDDYIYEYLEITGGFNKSSRQINRENNGRFGRIEEYRQSIERYFKNLLSLSRYGYTSVYEKEQFMWLSCWFGDLDKACSIAEEILQKEPNNLYAASYQAYLLVKQGVISGMIGGMISRMMDKKISGITDEGINETPKRPAVEKISLYIATLDKEENLCRTIVKTALAFCEIQQGNFQKVISILSEILDYSQMPFLNDFTEYYTKNDTRNDTRNDIRNYIRNYTPVFWQHGRKLSGHQMIVLCQGRMAYRDSYELLRSAYQLLLEKNEFDGTAESVLCMARAYLHTNAYEQAYHTIYNEQNKQTMIKNKCQTEYFMVMADVLFAREDYKECIKTAENLDRILSKNKEVFCSRWGKTAYDRAFCHNLYLLAECNLLEKNYENACFYSECLMEEDFTVVQVYIIYLKACFFLYKLDKVKQTYNKIHFLYDGWEAGYYAVLALLRQKEFWRNIQYEKAAEILWAVSRNQSATGYMASVDCTDSKILDFPQIRLLQNLVKAGLSDSEKEQEQIYEETLRFLYNHKEKDRKNDIDMEMVLIMAQFAMERNKSRDAYDILTHYQKEQKEEIYEPLFWYDLGVSLEAAGEEEEALQIYKKILQNYGVYGDVCIRLSCYYQRRYFHCTFSLEDKNIALQYLQRQKENEDIQPNLELAEYYYQLTEYEKAIRAIQVFMENKKDMPDLYYQRGYRLMGNCFLRIYYPKRAKEFLTASLNWKPENGQLYFEIAEAVKECKEYETVVRWHQKAVGKFGDAYDRGYEAIGDLYLMLSEPKKALAYYNMQWIFACDRTEADNTKKEFLKMRYYKRMIYFYLAEGQEETAFEWAEQGIQELSKAENRARLAMFYAEALMCRGVESALWVMEECMKRDGEELKEEKNYELLLEMEAQLLSYYFLTGKRKELAKEAEKFRDIFTVAYPYAKLEDYAEVKRDGPKRYGEIGWYYLALGKEAFAQQCFQKQWSLPPCIQCRSRSGCYRGYLNIARYYEAAGEYNRAIYFYKEVLGERHLPNHVGAKAALARLQKIPKAERGEEFRRW